MRDGATKPRQLRVREAPALLYGWVDDQVEDARVWEYDVRDETLDVGCVIASAALRMCPHLGVGCELVQIRYKEDKDKTYNFTTFLVYLFFKMHEF